jgi:hypothetical protein
MTIQKEKNFPLNLKKQEEGVELLWISFSICDTIILTISQTKN